MTTTHGWIKLHRSLRSHWLWQEKRVFSKLEAWLDILLLAGYSNSKLLLGNQLVQLGKGEFITSELKLMERWSWGKEKLRRFLLLLKEDGMIDYIRDRSKTTLKVINYCEYQEQNNESKKSDDISENGMAFNFEDIVTVHGKANYVPNSDQCSVDQIEPFSDPQTTSRPPADHDQTASRPPADFSQTMKRPLPDTIKKEKNNKKLKNERIIELFERFWEMYPNRVKKKLTLEIYTKILNKSDDFEMMATKIQDGLTQAIPYYAVKGITYTPHPSSWLNQERWNDEYVVPGAAKPIQHNTNLKAKAM